MLHGTTSIYVRIQVVEFCNFIMDLCTLNMHLHYAGGFLDQKSPFFQEEFPSLVSGGEEKPPQQKEEKEKEPQYGPGPSLRPQSKLLINVILSQHHLSLVLT